MYEVEKIANYVANKNSEDAIADILKSFISPSYYYDGDMKLEEESRQRLLKIYYEVMKEDKEIPIMSRIYSLVKKHNDEITNFGFPIFCTFFYNIEKVEDLDEIGFLAAYEDYLNSMALSLSLFDISEYIVDTLFESGVSLIYDQDFKSIINEDVYKDLRGKIADNAAYVINDCQLLLFPMIRCELMTGKGFHCEVMKKTTLLKYKEENIFMIEEVST